MTRKFLIVTALVAGVAATADAQICAGTAPFTAGNMRLGVGAEFPDGSKSYGGEFAYGLDNGMYVGGTVARWSADEGDASALGLAANGGYEMRFESMPKIRVCPTAHVGYISGPEVLPDANMKTLSYGLGAAIGGVLPASDKLAIVPSAHLRWTGARTSVDGVDGSETGSSTDARLSAGFVFNRVFTIAPTIDIPIGGEEGEESTFGFVASWNFGRSGGVMQQGGRKKNKR
jgi:hypothetical protein